jgi:hypothetical protein
MRLISTFFNLTMILPINESFYVMTTLMNKDIRALDGI